MVPVAVTLVVMSPRVTSPSVYSNLGPLLHAESIAMAHMDAMKVFFISFPYVFESFCVLS